jgi:AcrR family transcriptional regulator
VTTQDATRSRAAALPPDERRAAIVAAALPLVLEHGDRVTTRQIADAACVAEGTIFRVFADKDAVVTAIIEQAIDIDALEQALAAIDPDDSFERQLGAAVEVLRQRVLHIWQLLSRLGPSHRETANRPMIDSPTLVALFERHAGSLRVDPKTAARLLRAFTLTAVHPMLADTPDSTNDVVQLFLHGVGNERTSTC